MDSTIQQFSFHLLELFRDSEHVLEKLFEGRGSAGAWAGWISPTEGGPDVRLNQTLLGEYGRLQNSINEHLCWLENHPELVPKHKQHVKHRPPDGYALFIDWLVPCNVIVADSKPKPKIKRSQTATYWTIDFGMRTERLLQSLRSDFQRLKRFRYDRSSEEYFLYSFPNDVRENWSSYSNGWQDMVVANLGAKRVRSLRDGILEHLVLDFGKMRIRLENEIEDFERVGCKAVKPTRDQIAIRYFELEFEPGFGRPKQPRYEALASMFKDTGLEHPANAEDSQLKSILSDANKRGINRNSVKGNR